MESCYSIVIETYFFYRKSSNNIQAAGLDNNVKESQIFLKYNNCNNKKQQQNMDIGRGGLGVLFILRQLSLLNKFCVEYRIKLLSSL